MEREIAVLFRGRHLDLAILMRRNTRRLIAIVTLAAFLIVDGSAMARTIPHRWTCKACQMSRGTCDECISLDSDVTNPGCCTPDRLTATGCKGVLSLACPYQNDSHSGDSCPCPGGCAYCCVTKVPCAAPGSISFIFCLPQSWTVSEITSCYSSPFCGKQTPPPRAS